jgi:Pentapeptide repeats (8 copies)
MSHYRRGLTKLAPDLLAKAKDDTNAQITRIMLTFLSAAIFCVLSLLTPDIALLAGNEKLNVPLVGPVSFFGFMILGPAVLIVLRTYWQIYFEHDRRLSQVVQLLPAKRAPTLLPLKNKLIWLLNGFAFYLLLPAILLMFAWKAAVFPVWGIGLLSVAVAAIVMHVMLLLRSHTWWSRAAFSACSAILTLSTLLAVGSDTVRRPFNLFRANLSDQWLVGVNLRGAELYLANLAGAQLRNADMSEADLIGAKLSGTFLGDASLHHSQLSAADLKGADLFSANLSEADLSSANLSGASLQHAYLVRANLYKANLSNADLNNAKLVGANLSGADLSGANFFNADLSGADLLSTNLSQEQLDKACGTKPASLSPSLIYVDRPCAFIVPV